MNSKFGAVFFHRLNDNSDLSDDEIEQLTDSIKNTLSEYGMTFEQYEMAEYPQEDLPFTNCSRCGLLTAGFPLNELAEGGVLETFIKQSASQGAQLNGGVLCHECQAT